MWQKIKHLILATWNEEDTVDIYKIEREHAKKKGIVCYKFWRLSALSDSMVNDSRFKNTVTFFIFMAAFVVSLQSYINVSNPDYATCNATCDRKMRNASLIPRSVNETFKWLAITLIRFRFTILSFSYALLKQKVCLKIRERNQVERCL